MGGLENLNAWLKVKYSNLNILLPGNPVMILMFVAKNKLKNTPYILLVDSAYFWEFTFSFKGVIKYFTHNVAAYFSAEIWASFDGALPAKRIYFNKSYVRMTKTLFLEALEMNKEYILSSLKDIDLAYIGRFSREKGVFEIAKVFKELPPEFKLAFIGSGKEKESLLRICKGCTNIEFLQFSSEKEAIAIYRRLKSIIIMSSQEGCSMVSKEAVVCGIKVFSYRFLGDSPFYLNNDRIFELKKFDRKYNINEIRRQINS
jgi:glycosyltransferase involved in cell wall biosynthesis